MSARTDLAAAASAVDGVRDVTPYYRQNLRPGDGCIRLARTERPSNGFGLINTWQVWLALGQDIVTAEKWLDSHADDLWSALDEEMTVTSLTPADLTLMAGAPSIHGVIVEGAREG